VPDQRLTLTQEIFELLVDLSRRRHLASEAGQPFVLDFDLDSLNIVRTVWPWFHSRKCNSHEL
jgi:hypothetical protein